MGYKEETYHVTDATTHAISKVQEISHSQRSGMSGMINKILFSNKSLDNPGKKSYLCSRLIGSKDEQATELRRSAQLVGHLFEQWLPAQRELSAPPRRNGSTGDGDGAPVHHPSCCR